MSNSGYTGSFYNWGTPTTYSNDYFGNTSSLTPAANESALSIQSPYYYNKSYIDPTSTSLPQTFPQYAQQSSIENKSFASSGYSSEFNNSSFNSPVNYIRNYPVYSNYSNNASFISETASPNYYPKPAYVNSESHRNENNKRPRNETSQTSYPAIPAHSIDTEAILNEIFQNSEPVAKKQKRAYNKKSKIVKEETAKNTQYDNSSIYLQSANYPLNTEFSQTLKQSEYLNYNDIIEGDNHNQDDDNDLFEDENDSSLSYSINSFGEKKKRVLSRSQRVAANQRERKRMNIMNDSYVKLRQVLPISTGRKRRKMSRLDIVVGAMEYIAYLSDLVERDEPCEIKFDIFKNSLYTYD